MSTVFFKFFRLAAFFLFFQGTGGGALLFDFLVDVVARHGRVLLQCLFIVRDFLGWSGSWLLQSVFCCGLVPIPRIRSRAGKKNLDSLPVPTNSVSGWQKIFRFNSSAHGFGLCPQRPQRPHGPHGPHSPHGPPVHKVHKTRSLTIPRNLAMQ